MSLPYSDRLHPTSGPSALPSPVLSKGAAVDTSDTLYGLPSPVSLLPSTIDFCQTGLR